jgi:hypothetical protein
MRINKEIRSRVPGHLVIGMIFPYLHCTISTCRSPIEEERELDKWSDQKEIRNSFF